MRIDKFEDIVAWQKAKELTLLIYKIFKDNKDYSFRDQIQRACVSVMNNIAEGFERKSNKEMKNFLYISKGSSGEVRSMLVVALSIKYINQAEYEEAYALTTDISRLLAGFIKSLS